MFGGAGVTLLWEGFLKPRREQRAVAFALGRESSHNLSSCRALGNPSDANFAFPLDLHLSDVVFQSLSNRIGELREVAGDLVVTYHDVHVLNAYVSEYRALSSQYDALATNTAADLLAVPGVRLGAIRSELNSLKDAFTLRLREYTKRLEELTSALDRAATPVAHRPIILPAKWRRRLMRPN